MQLGKLLREHRIRRGMTQQQLADFSTVSIRAIRDIEQGKAEQPRTETVRLISDALGLTGRDRTDFHAAVRRRSTPRAPTHQHAAWASPPAPLDTLVDRDREVSAVSNLLATGCKRLLLMTGLGAVGKTRLALEVADGMHRTAGYPVLWKSCDEAAPCGTAEAVDAHELPRQWSDLQDLSVEELLAQPERIDTQLRTVSSTQAALLVIDGCPGIGFRTDLIVPLLHDCHGLRILVTSRAPLGIAGGLMLPLPPLRVPSAWDEQHHARLTNVPSVQLLLQYMRQVQPDFEPTARNLGAVATLCRQVDGIPAALATLAPLALSHGLEALEHEARTDPLGLVGRSTGSLGSADPLAALKEAMESLAESERALLAAVASLDGSWSVSDAAALTGTPPLRCGATVQRLLLRGLVRPVENADRTEFAVLELVRRLHHERGE